MLSSLMGLNTLFFLSYKLRLLFALNLGPFSDLETCMLLIRFKPNLFKLNSIEFKLKLQLERSIFSNSNLSFKIFNSSNSQT